MHSDFIAFVDNMGTASGGQQHAFQPLQVQLVPKLDKKLVLGWPWLVDNNPTIDWQGEPVVIEYLCPKVTVVPATTQVCVIHIEYFKCSMDVVYSCDTRLFRKCKVCN